VKRVGKEVCQERKRVRSQVPELSTRKGPSRFRDYKRKPEILRKWHHQKTKLEKKSQGEKGVQTSSKQPEGLSRVRDARSKPDQEKVISSDKMPKKKKCESKKSFKS